MNREPDRWKTRLHSPVIGALAEATARHGRTAADLFVRRLAGTGGPLVEYPADDPPAVRVTFVYEGSGTEHSVTLVGGIAITGQRDYLFDRLPGTSLWYLTLRLPRHVATTYAFSIDDPLRELDVGSGYDPVERTRTWIRDPLNPRYRRGAPDPLRPGENPDLSLLDLTPGPLTAVPDEPRSGTIRRYDRPDPSARGGRRVWTYRPAAATNALLVRFDGWDAAVGDRIPEIIDAGITAGEIAPVNVLMIDSAPTARRQREMFFDEGFLTTVCDRLVPWAAAELGIAPSAETTAVSGVSAGAGMALYAAVRRPDVFGSVIAQASTCGTAVGGDRPGWLIDRLAASERPPRRVYLEAGGLETDRIGTEPSILSANRRLAGILAERPVATLYREPPFGHDGEMYARTLPDGLRFVLPST